MIKGSAEVRFSSGLHVLMLANRVCNTGAWGTARSRCREWLSDFCGTCVEGWLSSSSGVYSA